MENNIICFVAGHSGGHIIPCATQAKKELEQNKNLKILFFCTNNRLDNNIINNYGFINFTVNLPIYNIPKNPVIFFSFLWNLSFSFIKTFLNLKKYKPKKIVSMGGLVSIPVCMIGKLLGIPIELWELNIEPGKATKFLSNFVNTINICFKDTQQYLPKKKCNLVSYPVRFNEIIKQSSKSEIVKNLGFSINRKTVLVIGGSQGSLYINGIIKEWILLNADLNNKIQMIHQTGADSFLWEEFYQSHKIPKIAFSFHEKMEEFYLAADLIICRSGAGTLAEVLFFQKKCITIPLETATTNHQVANAKYLIKNHPELFVMIKQDDDKKLLFNEINKIIHT